MATTETSEREYSPKATGAAKGRPDRRRPRPAIPDLTQPHPSRRTYPGPDRTARYLGALATGPSHPGHPQSPTYRGHTTRIPPDIPGVRRSHDVPRSGSRSSSPRRTALAIALLFGISSVFTLRCAVGDVRLGQELVQLVVGGRPRRADQPEPRERRAPGPQGRLDADLDRPLAQQGHDHPRLLQPQHPGLRHKSSRCSTRRATATRSPARTSAGTTTPTTSRRPPSTRCS